MGRRVSDRARTPRFESQLRLLLVMGSGASDVAFLPL